MTSDGSEGNLPPEAGEPELESLWPPADPMPPGREEALLEHPGSCEVGARGHEHFTGATFTGGQAWA